MLEQKIEALTVAVEKLTVEIGILIGAAVPTVLCTKETAASSAAVKAPAQDVKAPVAPTPPEKEATPKLNGETFDIEGVAMDRKAIMAKLAEMGATIDKKQNTKYLANQLKIAILEAKTPVETETEASPFDEPTEDFLDEPKEEVIVDENLARETLKAYAKMFGNDKALSLLQSYKVQKVSELTQEQRTSLFNKANDAAKAKGK